MNLNETPTTSLEDYQRLHSHLIVLTERLSPLVEGLRIPTLPGEMKHLRNQIHTSTVKILVVGELNAGKSTIINALLKTKVLPAYPVPTTALVTSVKRGEQTKVVLHRQRASDDTQPSPLEVPLKEMERYLMFGPDREQTHNFKHAEVFLPLPSINNGIEFIDVISPYDDDWYENALEQHVPSADVILYALACDSFPSKEEALRIDWMRKASRARFFFLCNRLDLVEPQRRTIVKQRLFTYLCQLSNSDESAIFFTSAKGALNGYLHNNTRQIAQSNMLQLQETLNVAIVGYQRQKIQPIVAQLKFALRLSLQVVAARKELRHPNLQTRMDAHTKLLHAYERIEEERLRIDNLFTMIRSQVSRDVQSAAIRFYDEFVPALEHHVKVYSPGPISSSWDAFRGNSSERMVKEIITFLTETLHDRFLIWIASTLKPLLQERLEPVHAILPQDTAVCIVQTVERQLNCLWHSAILIKRLYENIGTPFLTGPGSDLRQMKTQIVHIYRRELEQSTRQLVAAITNSIESELGRAQQELVHPLDLELQCLRDVIHTSIEKEHEGNGNSMFDALLPALEDELQSIDRELCELMQTPEQLT